MEKAEQRGAISLETLERAARALNCRLVYTLVPEESFEETIQAQARKKAQARLERVSHTMQLENQAVSAKALEAQQKHLVEELINGNLHRLWDE